MTLTREGAASPGSATRGFRPGSRRRARIAAGVAIAAVAVGGNVLVYSSLDDTTSVIQFVDNVNAGDQIASDDIRIIEIDGDVSTANFVPADQVGLIVNQYARTFIPSGSLASVFVVQSSPLVTPGAAVVAVTPDGNLVPDGLRDRSLVRLIIGQGELTLIDARVVAVERNDAGGASSLSVEVNEADAPIVAAAEQLRVALLDPGIDPATEADG
jgi:hypothetical protein